MLWVDRMETQRRRGSGIDSAVSRLARQVQLRVACFTAVFAGSTASIMQGPTLALASGKIPLWALLLDSHAGSGDLDWRANFKQSEQRVDGDMPMRPRVHVAEYFPA
ncbi:unnamed protein product [Prorocentrum cordatum]|uniref:Uncharacterized protein n=1 Tax=Prorocentrum cordatum TaxID=2364126 RepID=A0ABN9Q6N2_9DINO|nr:unnamed protein product [Polarella glacialis]